MRELLLLFLYATLTFSISIASPQNPAFAKARLSAHPLAIRPAINPQQYFQVNPASQLW